MDLKGKRLLILGGTFVHCSAVEYARKMGVYTIVADNLMDSPAKLIADEKLYISILDVDGIVEWCKRNPVDGVLNYANDPVQKAHQQICERLGLPCYGSYDQTCLLTDKLLFAEMCVNNGIKIIPSYSEKDVVSGKLEENDYPILIKPADSRGSKGQCICNSFEEVIPCIEYSRSQSFSGNLVIQKYMEGYDDIQLSYLVIDGEPILLKIEDRYLGSKENGFDRLGIACVSPSVYEKDYLEKSNEKVKKMIKSIGLKNAPVFLQGFWLGNEIMLYDPGIRFPGDNFDSGYSRVVGVSTTELTVIFSLCGKYPNGTLEKLRKTWLDKYVFMLMPCLRPGTVGKMEGIKEILDCPEVTAGYVSYKEGDTVEELHNCNQRLGEFVVLADNQAFIKKRIEWIFSVLKVYDTDGNDMLIEKIAPDMIR